jgi:hypothetical protein
LHAKNLLNSHYATGGGTSLNHNTTLGNVEVRLHDAGVPVFLTSPLDVLMDKALLTSPLGLLMDKAPRAPFSDNSLEI